MGAAVIACAVLPPARTHAALASAAATLFEAAPLLLIATLLPRPFRGLAQSAGCGCGTARIPGALAPAAIAFCWIAFGPATAIARAVAGTAIVGLRALRPRRAGTEHGGPRETDPFAELGRLGACAAGASLLAGYGTPFAGEPVAGALAGLAIGATAPCATAGVALAAGFAPHAPVAAAAILATSGIVPRFAFPRRRTPGPRRPAADLRFAALLLAVALAALCARGPSGLVNPRLLPLVMLGVAASAAYAVRRRSGHPAAAALPAAMLAALAAGSPEPHYVADETTAAAGFPGESVRFTGVAHTARDRSETRLVRFAITCCRLDASAVAVALDRRLAVPDGTWIAASGTYRLHDGALVLAPDHWRSTPPPADPFIYK